MSGRRFKPCRPKPLDTHVVGNGVHHPGAAQGCATCRKNHDQCCVCGKSFRGHEPLTDGKGNEFHAKCAPKPDVAGMVRGIARFFGSHGVEEIEFTDESGRRKGGIRIPKKFVKKRKGKRKRKRKVKV